jgi:hypothetical protein
MFKELLHHKSNCHGTKPMHSPHGELSKDNQEQHDLKHPDSVSASHNYKIKQTTFLHP